MTKQRAFTLVELSIVLIIIGILIASVTTGSKLIRTAKVQKVISEFNTYKDATLSFFTTYNALPGDFTKGADFWGNDCDDGLNGNTDICSGDGDSQIELETREAGNSGYHLFRGEFIEASLTHTDSTTTRTVDTPFIRSSWRGASYSIWGHTTASNAEVNAASIYLGTGSGVWNSEVIMSTKDTAFIDEKLDDGLPHSGVFRGSSTFGANNSNAIPVSCSKCEDTSSCATANDLITTAHNKYDFSNTSEQACLPVLIVLTIGDMS